MNNTDAMKVIELQARAILVLDRVLFGLPVTADDAYTLAELQQAYSLNLISGSKRKFTSDRLKHLREHIVSKLVVAVVNHPFTGDSPHA